jgi:lysophospholipase L1-like esterase
MTAVLIVRPSSLGDVVHALPVVADVRMHAPDAAIDWVAEEAFAPLVRLQKVFEDACRRAPATYWIWDTVHPTYSGHQLIADEWERTVGTEN